MMPIWEQVLLGIFAVILVFLFWPGVRTTLERSRAAEERDWKTVVILLSAVTLFVLLLIVLST